MKKSQINVASNELVCHEQVLIVMNQCFQHREN